MIRSICTNGRNCYDDTLFLITFMSIVDDIPPEDRAVLAAALEEYRGRLPEKTPAEFMQGIMFRIYTELCCSLEGRRVRDMYPHAGNAYKKWVDQEVHFASEGMNIDAERYAKIRQDIVRAIAARAAELFSDWNGKWYPPMNSADYRNLRISLKSYIPSHDLPQKPVSFPLSEDVTTGEE